MLTFLLLILAACGPSTVVIDDGARQSRPGQTNDTGEDSGAETGDSDDSATDDSATDDSGTVGWAEVDDDGDGYSEDDGDCDDGDSTINPDAEEVWYDGVNQNCDDYSDYDQDGDGDDSWYVNGGEDCDDDSDGYYAVDCPALNGNNNRPDCDDRYSNVNPETHEDNTDGLDNNCNDVTDGLGIEIEWSLTYECVNDVCSEYGYGGILTVTITDDSPDTLVLLGGGPINTAEPIDVISGEAPASTEYEIEVVTDGSPSWGRETSFGSQASTVSYLYMSRVEAANGSRCIVWGPQAAVLATYDEDIECVDITDHVEGYTLLDGLDLYVSQYWNGLYE